MLVVIVGFNYDVVMMSVGCGPPPTWVLVVIVGLNYDIVMMYVGCGGLEISALPRFLNPRRASRLISNLYLELCMMPLSRLAKV